MEEPLSRVRSAFAGSASAARRTRPEAGHLVRRSPDELSGLLGLLRLPSGLSLRILPGLSLEIDSVNEPRRFKAGEVPAAATFLLECLSSR